MATSEKSSSSDYFVGSQEMNRKRSDHVEFSQDEEELIVRMYKLVGERWTLIAGRIPGRSAEEIEKYWVSRYADSGLCK